MFTKLKNLSLRSGVALQTSSVDAIERLSGPAAKGTIAGTVFTFMLPAVSFAATGAGKEQGKITDFIRNVTGFLLAIFAGVFICVFVWGALLIVTSAGNEDRARKGKKTLMNACIGLGLVAAVFLLRGLLLSIVGSVDGGGKGTAAPSTGNDIREQLNP
jgi:predicted permease